MLDVLTPHFHLNDRPTFSVVVPAFNEAEGLMCFHQRRGQRAVKSDRFVTRMLRASLAGANYFSLQEVGHVPQGYAHGVNRYFLVARHL